jgi:hypothetical protein
MVCINKQHFTTFLLLSVAFDLFILHLLASYMMDSEDEMMLLLSQEEENVITNQDEHLTILVVLLQLQANDLRNVPPTRGGSKFGRRKSKERHMIRFIACYMPIIFLTMD